MGTISIFEPGFPQASHRAVHISPRLFPIPLYLYHLSSAPQPGLSRRGSRALEYPSEYDTLMDIYIVFVLSYTVPNLPFLIRHLGFSDCN